MSGRRTASRHGRSTPGRSPTRSPAPSCRRSIQTSTYKQDGVGGLRGGYEYSRSANPTRTALEECLAALEGGRRGLAFASGLAAEDTMLRARARARRPRGHPGRRVRRDVPALRPGPGPLGCRPHAGRLHDVDAVRAAVRPGVTNLVWVETPTNPLLGIADIAALAEVAHDAGRAARRRQHLRVALPPAADRARRGRRRALHDEVPRRSLRRHRRRARRRRRRSSRSELAFHQNAMGAVAGPFDSWLVLRGIKTLGVRMDRHCANAERVVDLLTRPPRGAAGATTPGCRTIPGHEIAAKQMRGFGGMVSFRVAGGRRRPPRESAARTKLFTLGESLGGVESLIEHPGRMTHASVAGSPLEVPADLVRLSVGIETVDDLVGDLVQALAVTERRPLPRRRRRPATKGALVEVRVAAGSLRDRLAPTTSATDVAATASSAVRDSCGDAAATTRRRGSGPARSAGGGLRLAVVGYERAVTAEAGHRVGLSAGGRVVHVVRRPLDGEAVDALADNRPDVVLLVGGTDGGNAEVLLHNAHRLATAAAGAVVVAGNVDARDEVVQALRATAEVRRPDGQRPATASASSIPQPARDRRSGRSSSVT